MWSLIKAIVLIAVCIYAGSIAGLYYYQRDLMYVPPQNIDPDDMKVFRGFEKVTVFSGPEQISLEGWFLPPTKKDAPVIIAFHGNGGHPAWLAAKLKPLARPTGAGMLFAEYRGYDGNDGVPSETGLVDDGKAFAKWWKDESGYGDRSLILYGESLGTGVALRIAKEQMASAVIMEAPFLSAISMANHHYSRVPKVEWLLKDHWRNDVAVQELDMPKLFLIGAKDSIAPAEMGMRLYELAPEPKTRVVLEDAGHNNMYKHGALPKVAKFLDDLKQSQQAP
jgi:fermentation-respiration switch protein FrsA (DUF1100 family)